MSNLSERTSFNTVCKVLEQISVLSDNSQKSEIMFKFMEAFHKQSTKQKDDDFYPIMRLLLPQLERERGAYGIKEHTLAKTYIRILCLSNQSKDSQKLLNYRTSGSADFAGVAYWILRDRFSKNGDLTVGQVNEHLDNIATKHANQDPRGVDAELQAMILKMSATEQKWLIRILLKDMKLGLSKGKILSLFHPDANEYYDVTNDLKKLCNVLKDRSIRLNEIEVALFQPFRPMLCQRCDVQNVNNDIKKSDAYYVEIKYDGERFQMHMQDGKFKYFSRNSFEYTDTFGCDSTLGILTPKLIKLLNPTVRSCILDGEVICWNTNKKCFTTKGQNIDVKSLKVGNVNQPCFVVFDILLLNGQVLTSKPLLERFKILEEIIIPQEGVLIISPKDIVKTGHEILNLLNQAIQNNEEGIVVKDPASVYKPNGRNAGWYKIKPEYTAGLMVELDLLIIGGYHGEGRRRGLISQFLLGVADSKKNEDNHPVSFYSVARVGSGYSDDQLIELNGKLENSWKKVYPNQIPSDIQWTKEKPDLWVPPSKSFILQVKASELIQSDSFKTNYTLRFPRVEQIRYDKPWYDCLTLDDFNKFKEPNCGKLTASYALKLNEPKQRKMVKRTKEILSVPTDLQAKKIKNVETTSTIFQNKEICVFPLSDNSIGKSDLEVQIAQNGGIIAQNPGNTTFCIVADNSDSFRIANIIKLKKYNVVKPSWILKCIDSNSLKKWGPSDFISMNSETEAKLSQDYDKFGDSYTEPVTKDQLIELLDGVMVETPISYEDMVRLDKELFGKCNPFAIFRGCYAYFDEIYENDEARYMVSAVKTVFQCNGGFKESSITDKTTHVISFTKENSNSATSRNLSVIYYEWIIDSWKRRTLLDTSNYKLGE